MIAFACHGQDEVRRQLIATHVAIEQFRINDDLSSCKRRWRRLAFKAFAGHVLPVLMEYEAGRPALSIDLERHLGVHHLQEILLRAFGEELEFGLTGSLGEEV